MVGLAENHEFFLDKSKTYHIMCHSGGRSSATVEKLEKLGYNVINCEGGMSAI